MVSYEQARNIVALQLKDSPDIVISSTTELPYAWVFNYNTRQYLETGDVMYILAGNSPYFISKLTGEVWTTYSAYSQDQMQEIYEEEFQIYQLIIDPALLHHSRTLQGIKTALQLSLPELNAIKVKADGILTSGGRHRIDSCTAALLRAGITATVTLNPAPYFLHKHITIRASPAKVWDSLTNPALIRLWMPDIDAQLTSNWEKGSEIRLEGHIHGLPFLNKGSIQQIKPPTLLEYTWWSSLTAVADTPENYSVIQFQLQTGSSYMTPLTFRQTGFVSEVSLLHFNFYWNTTLALIQRLNEK
ncbi:immunity protein 35 of polymorphic toxin system [Chitinophaga dinghuensis]|uniref:Immunity protein 35 of polymorphic toxin system n=1 Tax=Chitinophaga dinghuensis TaxID=1539050 RepID=A0A327W0M6_9BACT|nr:SRPBCC domain-containing protein [Chitinophaga dinghuensis]RAJ81930.1 immunity protein 35 of polymorphic toxin system [Chitinophaga dinghuensis]